MANEKTTSHSLHDIFNILGEYIEGQKCHLKLLGFNHDLRR